ncbi:MAG: type II toxin-antitoxin system HicB family antitoxin [bacterium]
MLVKFDTYFDGDYWCARGINEDIFTSAKTYEKLFYNIREATELHLEEEIEKGKFIEILVMSEMEIGDAGKAAAN